MDSRLLLIYCMTLLYRESQISGEERSIALCQAVSETIKVPEASLSLQSPREITLGLKATLQWMIETTLETYPVEQLSQRIRVITRDEDYLFQAFYDGIDPQLDKEALMSLILSYRKTLRDYAQTQKVHTIISEAFNTLNFNQTHEFDYKAFVREINEKLEPYSYDTDKTVHPSIVDVVDFNQFDSIESLIQRSNEELSSDGVLKSGWQAINRMLGESGGFRRGEMVLLSALQHNFKSQFMLNLFKHFALYNTPYMRDPNKKPLLLYLSLENELPNNMMWLYANIKENETGEALDYSNVDPKEAAAYIQEKLSVNGYTAIMLRLKPNDCTVYDLFDLMLGYEAQGYEIHSVLIDYLNMVDKKGLSSQGPAGEDIRELYRRMRNFTSYRGITCVTCHQLSTEAKVLVRQRVDNFVKEIANKGYYDGSRRIDQEVDLEIHIHIVKLPNQGSYLTVQRGKHRTVRITEDKHQYCILPFQPIGGIRDDIHAKDSSFKSISEHISGQTNSSFFDF
jgi:hypothetical protein